MLDLRSSPAHLLVSFRIASCLEVMSNELANILTDGQELLLSKKTH